MNITPNNRVSVRLAHLDYIVSGMGVSSLIGQFRGQDCHKFLHWLQAEIKEVKSNLPSDADMGIVEVPVEHNVIGVFVFSKLAYKILCDSHGLIVPTALLHEIKCLDAHRLDAISAKPRRLKGNLWDAYIDKESWLEEVASNTKDFFDDILETLNDSDEMEGIESAFAPILEFTFESAVGATKRSNDEVVFVDLVDLAKCYGSLELHFKEPIFMEDFKEYGWFSHADWGVILLAKICLEMNEAFRVHMKRHARRAGDLELFNFYKDPDGKGFIKMWKFLRERYVEPRLMLEVQPAQR